MNTLKVAIVASLLAFGALAVSGTGDFNAASAKAHAKKGKPGKCGTFYYYSKKKRMCLNALLK